MSYETGQKDIMATLHSHDLRLTRVEERQSAMAGEIAEQTKRLEKLADKIEQLSNLASSLDGRQKLILAIITIGIPLIAGLEIWDKL